MPDVVQHVLNKSYATYKMQTIITCFSRPLLYNPSWARHAVVCNTHRVIHTAMIQSMTKCQMLQLISRGLQNTKSREKHDWLFINSEGNLGKRPKNRAYKVVTQFIAGVFTSKYAWPILKGGMSGRSAPSAAGCLKPARFNVWGYLHELTVQALPPEKWNVKGSKKLQSNLHLFMHFNS